MTKEKCISIFNEMIRGTPLSFQEKLLPIVSEYLTEIKFENYGKIINLIVQNPQLINNYLPSCISYYCRKYCICSIIFNQKTILYYE